MHISAVLTPEKVATDVKNSDLPKEWDVIVIGSGIGAVTAASLTSKGARVLVLESYLIPGGSSGFFERDGYTFDVGASMIFGFGDKGTTNLLTRALATVGQKIETFADPVQIHYHLPDGLDLKVHRDYEAFLQELIQIFPDEAQGIRGFYNEAWSVFNCLNSMELLSLEELRYLIRVFFSNPMSCLGLVKYLPQNVGDVARRHIKNPALLKFIDMECYCWSVVPADLTPMINAGMVFSDRHYGGINYPKGGVGQISQKLADGIEESGLSHVQYRARVKRVLVEGRRAVGVELVDGTVLNAKRVVSNATRWDTFEKLVPEEYVPPSEQGWRKRYTKSPSFLSIHLGVEAQALPPGIECHHILLSDWTKLESCDGSGTIFVSIPTLLDPSLAPPGHHIVHVFTPSWIEDFSNLSPKEYQEKKEAMAQLVISRLEEVIPNLSKYIKVKEVGTPRTHRRFLNRFDGTYGPIPSKKLLGLLSMPFNKTSLPGLYCVGDSTFPGQGLNAVAFSGFACAHRIAADLNLPLFT
uniref:prolycopene isomerase n=1 Tax=Gloeochaete wittrockiana TaxID=38269 RepID=A0A2D2AH14_9EUKA|nr:prolycopene isomerase [Gloeochaete wittrockiana]